MPQPALVAQLLGMSCILRVMPRYRLNLHNAQEEICDEEGAEYRDLDAARVEAIRGIRSFLSAELLEGVVDLNGHLDIVDDRGATLATVEFDQVVEFRVPPKRPAKSD